jgi:nitroreductase
MQIEINELIRNRFSTLAFNPRTIEQDKIDRLFEAARWAPSSMNEQPWRFVYAKYDSQEYFAKMLSILDPGNQEWAKSAGMLVLAFSKDISDSSGKQNRYAQYDTGQAVAYLTMQATADGLYCRQMGAFDRAKARTELNIPEGYTPVVCIAVGYRGETSVLSTELQEREIHQRERKDIGEMVQVGRWSKSTPFEKKPQFIPSVTSSHLPDSREGSSEQQVLI